MKSHNKTTSKHFEIFKKEAELWIDRLDLNDWRVEFSHVKEDDQNFLATCSSDVPGRVASINLNTEWSSEKISVFQLRKTAFHEVLELMLCRLGYLGTCRYLGDEEIPEETHVIIRKFENYFYGNASPKTIKKM